jgi:hypothetical protein
VAHTSSAVIPSNLVKIVSKRVFMSSCFSGDIVGEDAISRRRRKQAFRFLGISTVAAFCFNWFLCSPTLFPRVRQRLPLRVSDV